MNRRKLGRYSSHYRALIRNLSISLVEHGKIQTTIQKAKELRRYIEPLITIAKVNNLTNYKRLLSALFNNRNAANKLIKIGDTNSSRNGGYTSFKRIRIRENDSATVVIMKIIDYPNDDASVNKEPVNSSFKQDSNDFTDKDSQENEKNI